MRTLSLGSTGCHLSTPADERIIASDKIASATHFRIRYHTAGKRIYR